MALKVRQRPMAPNREIAMSQLVYDALQEQKRYTFGKSDYVFCNSQGKPLEHRNVNRRIWTPTLALLGIKHRRAYQTRHTAAPRYGLRQGKILSGLPSKWGIAVPKCCFAYTAVMCLI